MHVHLKKISNLERKKVKLPENLSMYVHQKLEFWGFFNHKIAIFIYHLPKYVLTELPLRLQKKTWIEVIGLQS